MGKEVARVSPAQALQISVFPLWLWRMDQEGPMPAQHNGMLRAACLVIFHNYHISALLLMLAHHGACVSELCQQFLALDA